MPDSLKRFRDFIGRRLKHRLVSDLAALCRPLPPARRRKHRLLTDLAAPCRPLPLARPRKHGLVSDLAALCRPLPLARAENTVCCRILPLFAGRCRCRGTTAIPDAASADSNISCSLSHEFLLFLCQLRMPAAGAEIMRIDGVRWKNSLGRRSGLGGCS